MYSLCKEAAFGPLLPEISLEVIPSIAAGQVRPITFGRRLNLPDFRLNLLDGRRGHGHRHELRWSRLFPFQEGKTAMEKN